MKQNPRRNVALSQPADTVAGYAVPVSASVIGRALASSIGLGLLLLLAFTLPESLRAADAAYVDLGVASLPDWLLGAGLLALELGVCTLTFLLASRRTSFGRALGRALGVHVLLAGLLTLSDAGNRTWMAFMAAASSNALFVALIWSVVFLFPFTQRSASGRREALEREVESLTLRVCLEPHFLMNALHAVTGLVEERPAAAQRLLERIGDLLRPLASLREDSTRLSRPLHEELAWLKDYAAIWEARYEGKILFRWHLSDEAGDCQLPALLLQPLVENAILHGALLRGEGGVVELRSYVEGGVLVCCVDDNGPNETPIPAREGTGLALVRRRASAWSAESAFELRRRVGGGASACLRLAPSRGRRPGQ